MLFVVGLGGELDGVARVDLDVDILLVGDLVVFLLEQFVAVEVVETEGGDIFAQSGIEVFVFAGIGVHKLDANGNSGVSVGLKQSNLCKERLHRGVPCVE